MLLLLATPVQAQENAFEPQPSIDLPAELDRLLRDYEEAWRTGDSAVLASLFTSGGYVPSDAGWIKGRVAIEDRYRGAGGDLRLRAIDYAIEGSVGFIVGAYRYGEEAPGVDRGNFVLALRQSPERKWLIVADLDRSNRR